MAHQELIEQLKPVMQHTDFDSLFELLCQDLHRSDKFLLKMELSRLNQSTSQSIDLRDRLSAQCSQVEIAGVTHFLTPQLSQQLDQLVKMYGGRLTVGAVEELLADVRKPQPIDPSNVTEANELEAGECELMALGHYVMRREIRRSFSTQVTLWQNPNHKHEGLTIDLSVGGCRVRTSNEFRLVESHPVYLHFSEFGREFMVPSLDQGVQYQLLQSESRRGYQYLRLKRVNSQADQDKELERVLQANSLRTVPEINHLIATTRSHGYERQLLPLMNTLIIACSADDNKLTPLLMLKTQRNQAVHQYWCDENNVSQLSAALSPERIAQLRQYPDNLAHGLLYSFHIHQQQQKLFFSATLADLQHANMVDDFLQIASNQASFRVHRIGQHQLNNTDLNRALRNPLTMCPYEPLVLQQLQDTSVLVTLQPLDTDVSAYQQRPAAIDPNLLRRFGMIRQNKSEIRTIASLHDDMRTEARFNMSTVVKVSQGFGSVVEAQSLDISTQGMKLKLTSPHNFKIDKLVEVALPQMQELAGKSKLSGLPYQIIGSADDDSILRLQAIIGKPLPGQRFLTELLSKNSNRLVTASSSKQNKQLVESIKNIALPRMAAIPLFIHKREALYLADLIGCSDIKHPLLSKIAPQATSPVNLQWLLSYPALQQAIHQVDKINPLLPQRITLAMVLPQGQQPAQIINVDQTDKLTLRRFLIKAIAQKSLLGLQIELSATDKPDLNYLQEDLSAISGHALHRARELETMLWQLKGCAMLLDVSEELLCRVGLESLLPAHCDQI
ncbi:PilZ domain-containing protein [Ferrimonas lipolytica]|uniref:PilZ domain-containing protein n=1 Tax=Ferrimonas lipolytica TaxID=2724191 RepID=A0A6H1UA63_9GAMM|nr:PilZ domain-containing protein [Ferrimonas lipolytica]QIZ75945.1 PilZ domain-containing protein [Ferrimonas lipolytica]